MQVAMRDHVWKSVFLAVFILCCTAPVSPSELLQVKTQNAGLLLLPQGWGVVSKDEAPEQNLILDWILNVQQVLYAAPEQTSAALGAALQIFLIWGSDLEGNEKPLPDDMLDTSGNLAGGLIGKRYGNVSELGEDFIETALENIPVSTYKVELSFTDEDRTEFHYKCTSLYMGEKRVLVLLKYRSEYEEYWHGQLETLLNAWVGSLTLTPTSAPAVASALSASPLSLPSLPTPTSEQHEKTPLMTLPEQLELEDPPAELSPHEQEEPAAIPDVWPVLLLFAFLCVFCWLVRRRQKKEKLVPPRIDLLGADGNSPVHDNQLVTDVSGFDRVYNILDQALSFIEANPSAQEVALPPVEDRAEMAFLPNMADTTEVLDELKRTFGNVFVLDALKNEIFKTLEMNAENPSILRSENVAPDCLVLKLCCDTLVSMLRTGRYHICKGILNNEGDELIALCAHINELRVQKTYITPQEAEKDASFISSLSQF